MDDTAKNASEMEEASTPRSKRSVSFDYFAEKRNEKTKLNFEGLTVNGETKINGLTVGLQHSIKMRVTLKKMKEGGKSYTLKFYGLDSTGEIGGVIFSGDFERLAGYFEVNNCVEIKNFMVQQEAAAFRSETGHENELILTKNSTVNLLQDNEDLPPIPFKFLTILECKNQTVGAKIDVLGIVVKNWGIRQKDEKSFRNINILDLTGKCIRITLWNQEAVNFGDDESEIIALRKALVMSYENEKCLTTFSYTTLWKNPTVDGVLALREWFNTVNIEDD